MKRWERGKKEEKKKGNGETEGKGAEKKATRQEDNAEGNEKGEVGRGSGERRKEKN